MILFAEISILSIFALKKFEINGFISTLTVWEFSIPFSSLSPFNDMIFVFMSIIISPIKSPTVSRRILFSIPAIAKELMPRASAILSIYGACGTILFVSYFLMDTGCIPESSANFAWVMPMRVRKYFIFSPIVIIFRSFCSLVAILIAHKNKNVHTI